MKKVIYYFTGTGNSLRTARIIAEEIGGAELHYVRALRCVASQCISYEPFPPARLMVPLMERKSRSIGKEIAGGLCQA